MPQTSLFPCDIFSYLLGFFLVLYFIVNILNNIVISGLQICIVGIFIHFQKFRNKTWWEDDVK